MKTSTKVLILTVVLTFAAFLTEPNGPLGAFWAPHHSIPEATGIQLPLFMILGLADAMAFGLGVSFLLFGYSTLKAAAPAPVAASTIRAAHLGISWSLINWWAHDSLHLHNGLDLGGLLGIEYAFHVTLIIAALFVARFFLAMVRAPVKA